MVSRQRKKILVKGVVQGVGFRPFVYRLAVSENLKGFVSNSSHGVEIEVEGEPSSLERFLQNLQSDSPVLAKITKVEISDMPVSEDTEFLIKSSKVEEEKSTLISPDVSICDDCLRELFDPDDRRYRYPFINCTNCGPRYTIIKDIPYDRSNTTMASFQMCEDCQTEYNDPSNRRFHAQPNGCSLCGPRVWLTDNTAKEINVENPIVETTRYLKQGKIVAVKGLGGFHLACDATNEEAVSLLRERKRREEKPLAVMSLDIKTVEMFAELNPKEKDLLLSPRRPIVLLKKKHPNPLAESVAPRNGYFGTMLPYTPLHYLLLKEGFIALVMTSGNISEEPIVTDNGEALQRLGKIADFFLMHNREIYIRNDDSVTEVVGRLPRVVRRSRGYVPFPIFLRRSIPSILAVGAELKNTICLTRADKAFLSQHIGDLENIETLNSFEKTISHLKKILQINPSAVAYDLHPDYLSTQWVQKQEGIPKIGIQHHHAHIASCLAENGRDEKVIGLSLDGTGYGSDGNVWGGEILIADFSTFERVGHFDYRPMPGGVAAIREPWRMGISYLYKVYKEDSDNEDTQDFINWMARLPILKQVGSDKIIGIVRMIQKKINTPLTSSLGRLFDGVAAVIGLRQKVVFEGQAAMELEMAMNNKMWDGSFDKAYKFEIFEKGEKVLISPDRVVKHIMKDVLNSVPVETISLNFHVGLVQLFLEICKKIGRRSGIKIVALSGGCFQNRFLLENLSSILEKTGFEVLTHSQVPPNDGGLALGQAVIASRFLEENK